MSWFFLLNGTYIWWRIKDCWHNLLKRSYQEYHVEIPIEYQSILHYTQWLSLQEKEEELLSFLSHTSLCSDCIKFTKWDYLMKECTIPYQWVFHQWYRVDLATENRDDWCSCNSKMSLLSQLNGIYIWWRIIDCWHNLLKRSYQKCHVEIPLNIKVSYVILNGWVHMRNMRSLSYLSHSYFVSCLQQNYQKILSDKGMNFSYQWVSISAVYVQSWSGYWK